MKKDGTETRKMKLLNDQSLAELLEVSVQWVRQDRCNRKYGREHALDVDPILIGKTRRYRLIDIEAWLAKQEHDKAIT